METQWMGRYRDYVAELVRHANLISRSLSTRFDMCGVMMNTQEWQVFEYIVEHRFDDDRMIHISDALQIPQSTFSRTAKYLCDCGLVDKYQMTNNRKNIILKPSAYGLEVYATASSNINTNGFTELFAAMDSISDEDLETITAALRNFNNNLFSGTRSSDTESKLIKL